MQSTGQTSTHDASLTVTQGETMTYAMGRKGTMHRYARERAQTEADRTRGPRRGPGLEGHAQERKGGGDPRDPRACRRGGRGRAAHSTAGRAPTSGAGAGAG